MKKYNISYSDGIFINLYDLKIDQLSDLVHKNGGILVQAHPFRKGIDVLVDLKYLDGVEVYVKKDLQLALACLIK